MSTCTQEPSPERESAPWHCLMCPPYFHLPCSSEGLTVHGLYYFSEFQMPAAATSSHMGALARGATPSSRARIMVFVRAVTTAPKNSECFVLLNVMPILLNVKFFRETSHYRRKASMSLGWAFELHYSDCHFFCCDDFFKQFFLQGQMENISVFTWMEQSFSLSSYLS